jgi:hypothetical protein
LTSAKPLASEIATLSVKLIRSIILLVVALIWCGAVGFLDSQAIPGVVEQARTVDFPTVPGTVIHSDITESRGSKGSLRRRADIRYRYVVNDQQYTGTRLRLSTLALGDGSRQARAAVAAFPVGKTVPVSYDPADPAQSLLQPGLLPEHLIVALFAVPHHLIGILLLLVALRQLRRAWRGPLASAPIRHLPGPRIAVRMPWMSPLSVGLLSLGICSISGGLLAVIIIPAPTLTAALLAWAVVLTIAISLGLRRALKLLAGEADLIIDAGAKTVTLPLGQGRKQPLTFPFAEVQGLEMTTRTIRTTTTHNGHRRTRESKQYDLALLMANHQTHMLMKSGDGDQLRAIGETLHDSLGWVFKESYSAT